MGFGQKRTYKPNKPKAQRGNLDAQAIEEAIIDSWEGLQDHFDDEEKSVNDEMKAHFNKNWPGCGDALIGEAADFQSKLANLSADEKMAFFDELFAQNVIDKEALLKEE